MHLIPIETTDDFLLAEKFLLPHEETCATLASLVRRRTDKLVFISGPSTPLRDHSSAAVTERSRSTADSLLGILNLDSTIYHCIPDPALLDADFLKRELPYLMKKPVRCISGEKKATDFLIRIFSNPAQVYDYKMMRFLVPSTPAPSSGASCVRAST